jgi:hypothetical protein
LRPRWFGRKLTREPVRCLESVLKQQVAPQEKNSPAIHTDEATRCPVFVASPVATRQNPVFRGGHLGMSDGVPCVSPGELPRPANSAEVLSPRNRPGSSGEVVRFRNNLDITPGFTLPRAEGRPRSGRGGSSEPAVNSTTSGAVGLSGPSARLSQRRLLKKSLLADVSPYSSL